jgi:hypothetical protein
MEEAAGTPPLEPVVAPLSTTGKEGWRLGVEVEEGQDLADEDHVIVRQDPEGWHGVAARGQIWEEDEEWKEAAAPTGAAAAAGAEVGHGRGSSEGCSKDLAVDVLQP